ncbi:phage head-tail adapter protein [Clostridium botulinum]
MDAGRLNKRICIMEYGEIENEIKEIEQQLIPIKKLWACKIDLDKGGEYIETKKTQQKLISKFIVRKAEWITQNMLIKYKNNFYNIIDIVEKDNFTSLFVEIKDVGTGGEYEKWR